MALPTTSVPASRAAARQLVSGLLGIIVGSLAVNGLPHLVQGMMGESFQTPFGADSSARVNLAWGAANLILAAGTGYLAHHRLRSAGFLIGAGAGVVGTAASLLVVLS